MTEVEALKRAVAEAKESPIQTWDEVFNLVSSLSNIPAKGYSTAVRRPPNPGLPHQEITIHKDLDGREAMFSMENYVYMASPRTSGANSPDCQWYNLQPKEGENDKGMD